MISWGYVLIAHTKRMEMSRVQKVDSGGKKCILKLMRAKTKCSNNNSKIKEKLYSKPLAISDHLNCLSLLLFICRKLIASRESWWWWRWCYCFRCIRCTSSFSFFFFQTTHPNIFFLSLTRNDYYAETFFSLFRDIIPRKQFHTRLTSYTLPFIHSVSFLFFSL